MEHIVVGSLFVAIVVIAGWLIVFYSNMVNKKTLVEKSWRLLGCHIQKRNEVIKKIIESSSDSISPELEYLNQLIQENGINLNRESPCDVMGVSLKISNQVAQLKIDNLQIMHEITDLEQQIEKSYDLYNEEVQSFNKFLSKFPNNFAGQILGSEKFPMF
ncbi:MAG: hypothetical protein APF84_09740 [Gracilibacter sp. BRH_c7a]|nr:MAG: hypothetical protein APF84_09740 [Gracilibacter sp. BRH_c7a]